MLLTLPCLAIVFQPGPEFKHGSRQGIRPCFRAPMPGEAAPSPDEILSDKRLYPGQSFRPLEAGRLRIDSGGRCQPRLQPFERRQPSLGKYTRFDTEISLPFGGYHLRKQPKTGKQFVFFSLFDPSPHENSCLLEQKRGLPP